MYFADSDNLLRTFQSVSLPSYVAPAQRPAMGQHNDRLYGLQQAILQGQLDQLAAQQGLAAALRALYDQQVDIGFIQDDLSQVSYFRYRAPGNNGQRFFIVQFNPRRAERFKGAGRTILPRGAQIQSVADTSCYLCIDNIRWQHRGVQSYYQYSVNGRTYNALCNPFPFTRTHLTMAAGEHLPQSFHVTGSAEQTQARIRRIVEDLYSITEQIPSFVGFYNGAGAGASIEKHLHFHFFEIPDGHGSFPIQTAARLATRTLFGHANTGDPAQVVQIPDYPLTAYRVRGPKAEAVEAVVDLAVNWDRRAGEAASANIIALSEEGAVSLYFVPRNRFYTRSPGLAGMVAGLETLGEFIFSTPDEQRAINEQRVNYDYLWRILEAVRPAEDGEQS
ncbi:MAG TPA: DUF4922 domain-containing protein [Anaerolineae bacterium]|nr:DUF4922 domain-containing protein [Anaerolineae bacterium]